MAMRRPDPDSLRCESRSLFAEAPPTVLVRRSGPVPRSEPADPAQAAWRGARHPADRGRPLV